MIARVHIVHEPLESAGYIESQASESVVDGMTDDMAYSHASQLCDQGYGNFE